MDSRGKDHNPDRENFYKVWQREKWLSKKRVEVSIDQ